MKNRSRDRFRKIKYYAEEEKGGDDGDGGEEEQKGGEEEQKGGDDPGMVHVCRNEELQRVAKLAEFANKIECVPLIKLTSFKIAHSIKALEGDNIQIRELLQNIGMFNLVCNQYKSQVPCADNNKPENCVWDNSGGDGSSGICKDKDPEPRVVTDLEVSRDFVTEMTNLSTLEELKSALSLESDQQQEDFQNFVKVYVKQNKNLPSTINKDADSVKTVEEIKTQLNGSSYLEYINNVCDVIQQ